MTEGKRSYKPGVRGSSKIADAANHGKMSRNRWAWVKTFTIQMQIWADFLSDDSDIVSDIKIMFINYKFRPTAINLTGCTEEELLAVKELFDRAYDLAMPVVKARDRKARDAFEQGDDSFDRYYRQVPQRVYRERAIEQYSKSILDGPSDDAAVLPDGDDLGGDVRDSGPEVAERDEG